MPHAAWDRSGLNFRGSRERSWERLGGSGMSFGRPQPCVDGCFHVLPRTLRNPSKKVRTHAPHYAETNTTERNKIVRPGAAGCRRQLRITSMLFFSSTPLPPSRAQGLQSTGGIRWNAFLSCSCIRLACFQAFIVKIGRVLAGFWPPRWRP